MNWKFRTRLFLFYIGGVCLTILVLAGYFINVEEGQIRRSTNEQLLVHTKFLAELVQDKLDAAQRPLLQKVIEKAALDSGARVTVIDPDGRVLGDSAYAADKMENHKDRPEIKTALSGKPGLSSRFSDTIHQDFVYAAAPVLHQGKTIGVVRIAKELSHLNKLLNRMKSVIILGVAAAALLAVFGGIIAMRHIIKPVLELQRMAVGISRGDLNARVRYFGHDELADLGLVFNSMAQQLSDSFNQLHEEKRKLEVILNNLSDGILVIDGKLKVVLANPAACEMLGVNLKNLNDRPIMEAVMNHHLWELIREVSQSKQPFESELTLHYPENRHFQVSLAPLRDETTGGLAGSIIVLHDLTQIRRLERVRQDFVANVSHELRTPITSVKAMTETLLGGAWKDQEMLHRYLRAIDQESDRLTHLINDLLVLARLDAKVAALGNPFDLVDLIREVEERFASLSDTTVTFRITLPQDRLPMAFGNRDQIKQVLINLLDNAFKYTPAGGQIRLSAWRDGEMIKISVADTGIGIPQDELDRIFERFYRVDKGRSREMGGTGLGLSIVKHIVEGHGGKVSVESAMNRGSVFSFTLPIKK